MQQRIHQLLMQRPWFFTTCRMHVHLEIGGTFIIFALFSSRCALSSMVHRECETTSLYPRRTFTCGIGGETQCTWLFSFFCQTCESNIVTFVVALLAVHDPPWQDPDTPPHCARHRVGRTTKPKKVILVSVRTVVVFVVLLTDKRSRRTKRAPKVRVRNTFIASC